MSKYLETGLPAHPLFSQEEKPWPIQNHRAEFALKLIKHGVARAIAEAEFPADMTVAPERVSECLINQLYNSYCELRRKHPKDQDPTMNHVYNHTYTSVTARIQLLKRDLVIATERGNTHLIPGITQQIEELYWSFMLLIETSLEEMSKITNLGMLLAQPNIWHKVDWRLDTPQDLMKPEFMPSEAGPVSKGVF